MLTGQGHGVPPRGPAPTTASGRGPTARNVGTPERVGALMTSRRVVATAFGGPESLAFEEVELLDPGPHEVRLEVRAIGVNPYDVKVYAGPGDPSRLPLRVGSEAAGGVPGGGGGAADDRGPLAVGDEVIAFRAGGAYATDL